MCRFHDTSKSGCHSACSLAPSAYKIDNPCIGMVVSLCTTQPSPEQPEHGEGKEGDEDFCFLYPADFPCFHILNQIPYQFNPLKFLLTTDQEPFLFQMASIFSEIDS